MILPPLPVCELPTTDSSPLPEQKEEEPSELEINIKKAEQIR